MTTIPSTVKSFGLLCELVTNEPSLLIKRDIINAFIRRFNGDLTLLFTLLLPKLSSRVYYVQEKQLLAVLSEVLDVREEKLKEDWNKNGCIAETALLYFNPSQRTVLDKDGWCSMSLVDFDRYLQEFASASTNPDRITVLKNFFSCACRKTTYYFLREVKQDLRLNAGQSTILEALHPNAYTIYKHCASIPEVVKRIRNGLTSASGHNASPDRSEDTNNNANTLASGIELGIPITPMLAAPVRSVEDALRKCPNGAYSEVKYDGERIQVHKNKDKLYFFSRSLKPMRPDKYASIESYLETAIQADTCILDGEILMVDQRTSVPLPFGTLGSHKRQQFATACPCIYFFDILLKDGMCTTNLPLCRRRELLKSSVTFIRNRVMFSELCVIEGNEQARRETLQNHLNLALCEGLEGLVIKDIQSVYEPRARHWLKIKKDYLDGLADLADLLVIGAWYGSGSKGGQLMTFLMGCVDTSLPISAPGRVKTVCKVTNGLSDSTVTVLTKKYKALMTPTSVNGRRKPLPDWLDCNSVHVPDMLVQDYTVTDVMMIIGAEFTISSSHTSGISIRFPRVMRLRPDKNLDTATTLEEIQKIFRSNVEHNRSSSAGNSLIKNLRIEDASVRAAEVFGEADECDGVLGPSDNSIPTPEASNPIPPHNMIPHRGLEERMAEPPSGAIRHHKDLQLKYCMNCSPLPLHEDAVTSRKNLMICHCAAAGFQWSSRGFMGRITNTFGVFAQVDFDRYMERMNADSLGNVVMTEVSPTDRPGRVFIATMVVQQQNPERRSGVPIVNPLALEQALDKCLKLACQSSVNVVYLIKPPNTSDSLGGSATAVSVPDTWAAVEGWWSTRQGAAKDILISIFPSHDPQHSQRDGRRKRDGAAVSSHESRQNIASDHRGHHQRRSVTVPIPTPSSPPQQQLRLEEAFHTRTSRHDAHDLSQDAPPSRDPSSDIHRWSGEVGQGTKARRTANVDEVEMGADSWETFCQEEHKETEEEEGHPQLPLMHKVVACMAWKEGGEDGEEEEIEEAALMVRWMGGSAVKEVIPSSRRGGGLMNPPISPAFTHVILPSSARLNRMDRPARDSSSTKPHVVTTDWVKRCFDEGVRFSEDLYHPSIKAALAGYNLLLSQRLSNREHWKRVCNLVGAKIHSKLRFIGEPTTYCIADEWCDETRDVLELGIYVLRPEWLLESAVVGYPLRPSVYALPQEEEKTTLPFNSATHLLLQTHTRGKSGEEDEKPFSSLLSGIPFYVLPCSFSVDAYASEVMVLIKQWGGVITKDASSAQYCLSTLSAFKKERKNIPPSTQLKCLDVMWVMECIQKDTLLSPSSYLLLDQVGLSSLAPVVTTPNGDGIAVEQERSLRNEEEMLLDSDTTVTVSEEHSISTDSTDTVIDEE